VAVTALAVGVAGLSWSFGGGVGLGHLGLFIASTTPGLPLGWRLFGRRHPAGWLAGALLGYALTGALLWAALAAGLDHPWQWLALEAGLTAATLSLGWRADALTPLPAWSSRDTLGLVLAMALVPMLVGRPFSRVGEIDAHGNRLYRSYFTADFVWHMALTSELARLRLPPRDPYAAPEPLHYYWTYFLLPAAETAAFSGGQDNIADVLRVNALGAGLLFVAAIWLFAWAAVADWAAATLGVWFAVVSSSLEGLYVAVKLLADGASLTAL
jgi:hypothetical protein